VTSWTSPAEGADGQEHQQHGQEHHVHLPAGAHVADRRGLTAMGAATIGFAVCFIVGSALAALLAHHEDLKATIVMPPLIYCVLALVGAAIGHTARSGSFVKQNALELVSSLISGAPVLYAATGLALVIALVRLRTARRP
jgi:biotin transporter BioY